MTKDKKIVIDLREQTFNQGEVGPMDLVSTPVYQVNQLRMIMIDIDLKLFRRKGIFSPEMTPDEFFHKNVAGWLANDPVLSKAEVRFTGTGFHALLPFDEPVSLRNSSDIKRWTGITFDVQTALPGNPQQPGINALTRPVGSVNGKNGEKVRLLKPGEPITQEEACELAKRMRSYPFATIQTIWFGGERVVPCPVCQAEDSCLEIEDPRKNGRCDKCSQVTLIKLIQSVLTNNMNSEKKGGENHA